MGGVLRGNGARADYNIQTNEHCFVYNYGQVGKEAWDWTSLHQLALDNHIQWMGGAKVDLLAPPQPLAAHYAPQPMYAEPPRGAPKAAGAKKGAKGCVVPPSLRPKHSRATCGASRTKM